jgi:hypothetical protein
MWSVPRPIMSKCWDSAANMQQERHLSSPSSAVTASPSCCAWCRASQSISPNERQGGTWDVFFWVRDAHALHAELHANGADIVYGPVFQEAYQMQEFAVRDHDGYVLGFGQPAPGRG